MNDFTKENKKNVSLIFDAKKKDAPTNYSWQYYGEHPEMKKYLIHEHTNNGYSLRDSRTNNIVISASFSLESFLE